MKCPMNAMVRRSFSSLTKRKDPGAYTLMKQVPTLQPINTHNGRNNYLCIPFGLQMSWDIYPMRMDQITDQLPSVITIHDDICIYGQTPEEHDSNLMQLMKTVGQNGVVFNSKYCNIWQPEINFYSAIFTSKGMKPDPTKVQAIQDIPTPENRIKSFLGLINYLQSFIAGLSD